MNHSQSDFQMDSCYHSIQQSVLLFHMNFVILSRYTTFLIDFSPRKEMILENENYTSNRSLSNRIYSGRSLIVVLHLMILFKI